MAVKSSMLLFRSAICASTLFFTGTPAMGQNAPGERRTAIAVQIGLDPVVAGQLVRGAETSSSAGTLRVHDRSFSEIYRQAWMVGAEVNYVFAERREALVRVTYTRGSSHGPVEFRETILRFPSTRTAHVAEFTNYGAVTIEGGFRWHLRSAGAVRPYVSGMGGPAIVRTIRINPPVRMPPLQGPGMASDVFFRQSAVPTISGISGLSFVARPDLHFRIETGLRYQGRPKPEPLDARTGPWLNDIYDGLRWSVPVTATVQFRF